MGDQIQRRDAFRDSGRVVVAGWKLDDSVPQSNLPRPLRGRGEEDLRRGAVRVLLQVVVLDFPDAVEAELVGELDLLEGVGEQLLLGAWLVRPRQLMLVEQ